MGLRQGEALGLRWADVDLAAGRVTVRWQLQRLPKGGGLALTRPKTEKSRRVLSLPATLAEWMRQHRAAQLQVRLAEGPRWVGWHTQIPHGEGKPQDADLVFPGWTGRPIDPTADSREWHRVLDLAKVPQIRLHDARHTAATMMLAAGVAPRVVMEILGHSQISLTMNTYSHVLDQMHGQAAAAVDGVLFRATANG
jgi:integrase